MKVSRTHRVLLGLIAACIAASVAGCSTPGQASTSSSRLTTVRVGMGYIPNVQFAPFYMAQSEGYYRKAGLNVKFNYAIEPNLLKEAALGKIDIVNAGGDEVLAAAAQGIGVTYVMTEYSRFPSALFALASSHITKPAQLKNKSIGVPGKYGASYVGLLVLLQKAGLSTSDVKIDTIGYSQVQSVATHKVDAAVGYAMNEPIELHANGVAVSEMDIANWANIAGAGLAVGNGFLSRHPTLVKAFVAATLHGLRDTLRDPTKAFTVTLKAVPGLHAQSKVQRAVLLRSLDFWQAEPGHPLGWIDPKIWSLTGTLLYRFHQINRQVVASKYYTERFIPSE